MDIDGEPWGAAPSIGCDEYQAGALTGPLQVGITASWTNVPTGFAVQLTARIDGRPATSAWDFGDGIGATNQPYTAHAWAATGDYAVVLRAVNESQPDGISATVTVHVVTQPVFYVAMESPHPLAPYSSWATAATNIQDAVDAAKVPGSLVLVTNGIYGSGGRGMAQVVVDKLLTLRSVNGAAVTTIDGGNSNRCVYLADGTSLSGFTLADGFVFYGSGGGLYCETTNAIVSNCLLAGNVVGGLFLGPIGGLGGGVAGGGAYGGTLNNCVLSRNGAYALKVLCGLPPSKICSSSAYGGGACGATLNNCTLMDNSAYGIGPEGQGYGSAAYACLLNNCISFLNYVDGSCEDCKAPGHLVSGNNWAGDPLFVDLAGGNLRLQSNSPCINAGNNTYAVGAIDLDGKPRVQGGTVDIGAYEFQSPSSVVSYAWLQQHGLPTDGSADFADPDADGMKNWQEWRCGTDPTNALSVLRLLAPSSGGTSVTVTWQSVAGVNYFLERSTNLTATSTFTPLATGIPGQQGTTTYTDTNAVGPGSFFYRVGVGD
jgi:PKD repeat protein